MVVRAAVAQAVGGKILEKIKNLFESGCHVCGETAEDPIKTKVKIPGYTGKHEKRFCSQAHLDEWREFIEEWEEKNYEIPDKNKGSTCVSCMR